MDPAWREHLEGLKRFNEWENEQLRNKPPDYASALAWLSEASELVERLGPAADRLASREEHLRDLLAMRAALARASLQA